MSFILASFTFIIGSQMSTFKNQAPDSSEFNEFSHSASTIQSSGHYLQNTVVQNVNQQHYYHNQSALPSSFYGIPGPFSTDNQIYSRPPPPFARPMYLPPNASFPHNRGK